MRPFKPYKDIWSSTPTLLDMEEIPIQKQNRNIYKYPK